MRGAVTRNYEGRGHKLVKPNGDQRCMCNNQYIPAGVCEELIELICFIFPIPTT